MAATKADWPAVATVLSIGLFFALLLTGAVLVAKNSPSFDKPETSTTVRVVKGPGARRQVTRVEWERDSASGPRGPGKRTVRSKAERPDGAFARSKKTTETHPRSFLESLIGKVGLYALQAAIVFLAAFVGAALFQRVLVGNFRFKIGALDLTDKAVLDTGVHSARFDKELAESLEQVRDRMEEIEDAIAGTAPAAALGDFAIKVPDASQLVENVSENLATINAQGGVPFQGVDYFKAKINEPDEDPPPQEDEPDGEPPEQTQGS